MNPVLVATLRRHAQVLGAAALVAALALLHTLWFGPLARRYEAAAKAAGQAGVLDPAQAAAPVPPRVFAVLTRNTLPAAEAAQKSASGQLTVSMLEDLTGLASASGLEVSLTEPGPVNAQANAIELRAHLRLRGRYREFVALLDALAGSGRLDAVERFELKDQGEGRLAIELWVKRLVLKQGVRS